MSEKRKSHAPKDLSLRYKKAKKIDQLIKFNKFTSPVHILEIGTGSGGISHYFANHPHKQTIVDSVDIRDERCISEGVNFALITDTNLPFDNDVYDLVISNHVIEHVGDLKAQLHHLKEIHRVLKPSGIGYLALPNRWMMVEPHYRLIFLSWLPKAYRTPYLKLFKKGEYYDCEPLSLSETESLLKKANLKGENLCYQALLQTYAIERPNSIFRKILDMIPQKIIEALKPAIPTLIYKLEKDHEL